MFFLQAEVSGVHPLYYMLPVAISCSLAFMFPVATPPNAIGRRTADNCLFTEHWSSMESLPSHFLLKK